MKTPHAATQESRAALEREIWLASFHETLAWYLPSGTCVYLDDILTTHRPSWMMWRRAKCQCTSRSRRRLYPLRPRYGFGTGAHSPTTCFIHQAPSMGCQAYCTCWGKVERIVCIFAVKRFCRWGACRPVVQPPRAQCFHDGGGGRFLGPDVRVLFDKRLTSGVPIKLQRHQPRRLSHIGFLRRHASLFARLPFLCVSSGRRAGYRNFSSAGRAPSATSSACWECTAWRLDRPPRKSQSWRFS